MHEPTPPARRVAALRLQVERLLQDAAAWGCYVSIAPRELSDPLRHTVNVYPSHPDAQTPRTPRPE